MEFLFFIGGTIVGFIFTKILHSRERIHGVLEVDHNNNTCRFLTNLDEVSNRKHKEIKFLINHDANISRDEQSL